MERYFDNLGEKLILNGNGNQDMKTCKVLVTEKYR